MKKVLCIAVLMLLVVSGSAFALLDDNSQNSNSAATATATGGSATGGSSSASNSIGNGINNFSPNADASATIQKGAVDIDNNNRNENRNTNMQGQLQGQKQTAVGKVNTDVNVEGDTIKSYAIAFPSVSAVEGTSSGTATYLFGSLGKANTETYKKIIPQIQTILAIPDDIMSKEEKKATVAILVKKMTDSNKTQRFLGILWEDNSKSLLNILGLLTWDSVWAEGQRPLQCKSDMAAEKLSITPAVEAPVVAKTEDVGITGNAGNLPGGNQ